jgi:hypothetical protein
MAQLPMYPAQVNSPETTLAVGVDSTNPNIRVVDASVLLPAPNLMIIRVNDYDMMPETIRYNTDAVDNVFYGVERGFDGVAKALPEGAIICRILTAYDANTWRHNIEDILSIFSAYSLEDLNDTEIDSPVDGEVLMYDGTKWINDSIDGGTA